MRIPRIQETNETESSRNITIHIHPTDPFEDPGMFDDKKEYAKWMERMKKMIRTSNSYTEYVSFTKRKRGLDHCGIHPNLKLSKGMRIELHHTPFTLEDIVHIIVNKRMQSGQTLRMTDIAKEVMYIHYLGLVGLYPLCALCHKAIHSESIGEKFFIPISAVNGDPEKFVDIYRQYMPHTMAVKWENIWLLNEGYKTIQKHKLPIEIQRQYIYIQAPNCGETISTERLFKFIQSP